MLSASEMGVNSVPAFLSKIWALVEDPLTDELIAWDLSGMSFHVFDQARFAKEILPLYFKHNNIASFIRQLNMYGFKKVVHLESGSMKTESDDVEFHHQYFMKGQENLLENIKRKSNTASVVGVKTEPGLNLKEEDVNRVLTDVKFMKGKQDSLSSKMDKMKKENEALWREVASMRQKHIKQQQIVNKLIQFMVHLVGGNSGMPGPGLPKRKLPLMINDASQVAAVKRPRYAKQLSIEELQQSQYVVKSPPSVSTDMVTPSGPVIQEVIDTRPSISQDVSMAAHNYSRPAPSTSGTSLPASRAALTTQHNYSNTMAAPSESTNLSNLTQRLASDKISFSKNDILGASLDSTDLNNLLQVVDPSNLPSVGDSTSNSNILDKYIKDHPIDERTNIIPTSPADISGQLEHMQEDLDGLKDILSGNQYNFDPSTLLTLFNSESNVPISVENLLGDFEDVGLNSFTMPATEDPNTITGNELVQFQPTDNFLSHITDLSDIIDESSEHAAVATQPLTIPALSDPSELDVIDPMSFINTVPMVLGMDDQTDTGGLDTPIILETCD